MGTWNNGDGLYIKYGPDRATVGKAGTYAEGVAGLLVVEAKITLTALGTAAAIVDDNVFIPKGYVIHKVETIATTAGTSGGSAVLNVGLIRRDRSTEIDYDGIIAALPVADTATVGETREMTAGSTNAGALVGTTTSADYSGYLTADYDTAAFTAGVVLVKIYLRKV